ncbi:Ulp1 protease family, carboxy-terminal domain protein [Arachis hypogaea]|nr:Ulp1 protease family, carboxy-terminal domain protein [Arachis hypogaea]
MSSRGTNNSVSKKVIAESNHTPQSPSDDIGENLGSAQQKSNVTKAQVKNTLMEAIEISSSLNEGVKTVENKEELKSKEVDVPGETIFNKENKGEKYDALNSQIIKMQEVVTNLQNMASVNQSMMPMMPYFHPMPSQFYNHLGGFNPSSPPYPSLSMPMTMSPYASPFENLSSEQAMTDTIIKKLATPPVKKPSFDRKKSFLGVKKTNPKISRAQSSKKLHGKQFCVSETPSTDVVKSLLSNASPTGYHINQRMPGFTKLQPRNLGVEAPFWLPVLFAPPTTMELDDTEIMVATYIFGTNKDNEFGRQEILAKGCKFDATRDSFFNLIPKGWIDQTILDVYAHMLNDEEKTTSGVLRHWYMPTVFSQMALSGTIPSSQVREDYKEAFMGKVEVLRKIYVPVNEDNLHWYLVIFDMNQCQVILLDSNPDPKKKASKIFSIKQLALYLEGMLQHDSFYDFESTIRPKVSEFPILEALGIGRQRNDSFDCGIWVATWMKNCIWIDDYNIYVDDATRMRIAIDLIMKSYNLKKNTIIKAAKKNYKKFEEKNKNLVKK